MHTLHAQLNAILFCPFFFAIPSKKCSYSICKEEFGFYFCWFCFLGIQYYAVAAIWTPVSPMLMMYVYESECVSMRVSMRVRRENIVVVLVVLFFEQEKVWCHYIRFYHPFLAKGRKLKCLWFANNIIHFNKHQDKKIKVTIAKTHCVANGKQNVMNNGCVDFHFFF